MSNRSSTSSSTQPFTGSSRTVSSRRYNILPRIFKSEGSRTELSENPEIDQLVDIQQNVENFRNNHPGLLNPQVLYETHKGVFNRSTGLRRAYFEKNIKVNDDKPVKMTLVQPELQRDLTRRGYHNYHFGMVLIGVQSLVRKNTATRLLLTLYDKAWGSDIRNGEIASLEIELSENTALCYYAPKNYDRY